jgi:hypothetical protein
MQFALAIESLGNSLTALTEWTIVAPSGLDGNKKNGLFLLFQNCQTGKKKRKRFRRENLRHTSHLELHSLAGPLTTRAC